MELQVHSAYALPRATNAYSYIENDPVNLTDPTGRVVEYRDPLSPETRCRLNAAVIAAACVVACVEVGSTVFITLCMTTCLAADAYLLEDCGEEPEDDICKE